MRWESMKDWWLTGEYRYSDLHNDLAVDLADTVDELLSPKWAIRSFYEHRATLNAHEIPLGPVNLNSSMRFKNIVQRNEPRFEAPNSRGYAQNGSLRFAPYMNLLDNDTLELTGNIEATILQRYNSEEYSYQNGSASLEYTHTYDFDKVRGHLKAMGGNAGLSIEDSLIMQPFWSAGAHLETHRHSFDLYGGEFAVDPIIPLDTLSEGMLEKPLDSYVHAGAEANLGLTGFNLLLGYQYTDGVSPVSLKLFWPNAVLPYPQPTSTFITGIQLGRWRGLSLASTGYFSDKRPYVKNHTVLSFQSRLREKYQQLFIDLVADYWSERDPILFAGTQNWNRPILDIDLKFAVQVKTFRLFWKIDNIFNRRFAYVPGYVMPGLTFRWGFNWLLRGF